LDAIALKALAKDPAKRYASAASFAADLCRYVEGKPVEALPPRFTDRVRKFLRRNRTLVGITATAVAAVLATVALLVWGLLLPGRAWHDPLTDAKVIRLTDFEGIEQAAAISPDGRSVAFLADREGHIDVWFTEIGSNRYQNLTQGVVRGLGNPLIRAVGFTPDGALVSMWTRSADGSKSEDVNVMGVPAAGGPVKVYLRETAEFDWSPDKKQLVFHTTAPGDPLFVRAAKDAEAHQIYVAPPGVHCHFPTWSPDGKFIYFVRGEPPAHWDVWRLRPSGAEAERITSHNSRVSYPVLLDSRTLLYLATDADGSGPWLYVMDLAQRSSRRISFGLEQYTSLGASANGRRLVATVADTRSDLWRVKVGSDGPPEHAAVPIEPTIQSVSAPRFGPGYIAYVSTGGGRRGIWKLANGAASALWEDAGADRVGAPAIAPDGRVAFTVEKQDATQLYLMDSDGAHPHAIATNLAVRGDLAWSPDSRSIIGAIVRDGEPRLARIFLDGRPPQAMSSEYSIDPVWSPDGKYFVYSGADVGTTFPLRASSADGRPYGMSGVILSRGARRVAFSRTLGSLIILRGDIGRKNFWALDLKTGAERQLTDLPSNFLIGDFDVSPDGTEIIFDRVQESSSIALIERAR
jgi:Tol biopolymer transport system component